MRSAAPTRAPARELKTISPADAAPARAPVPVRDRPIRIIEPRVPGSSQRIREFWRTRRLIAYFGNRALEKRYKRTILGRVWIPLRPTADVLLRTLVFGGLLGIATGGVPYLVFFLVATTAWQLFAETAFWSTRSLELQRGLLRRMYVPRMTVLVGALSIPIANMVIYVTLLGLALGAYAVTDGTFYLELGLHTFAAAGSFAMLAALGLGVGLWLAAPNVRARDVRFSLRYVLGFLYFVTPVIYPFSKIPEQYQPIAALNPVVAPVETMKYGLLGSDAPSLRAIATSVSFLAFVWIVGLWLFARGEAKMADTV